MAVFFTQINILHLTLPQFAENHRKSQCERSLPLPDLYKKLDLVDKFWLISEAKYNDIHFNVHFD